MIVSFILVDLQIDNHKIVVYLAATWYQSFFLPVFSSDLFHYWSYFAWQRPFLQPSCFCLAYHTFLPDNQDKSLLFLGQCDYDILHKILKTNLRFFNVFIHMICTYLMDIILWISWFLLFHIVMYVMNTLMENTRYH